MKFKKLEIVYFKVINDYYWENSCQSQPTTIRYIFFLGLNESSIVPWSLSIENSILVEDIRKELGVSIFK